MLLNATHRLTYSGLPSDVLDAYVRYKKATRALLVWFQTQSRSKLPLRKSLAIKELEELACEVIKNVSEIPENIDFYFREAIAGRNVLSKFYHNRTTIDIEAESCTSDHEHFTAV
jgi:hypothetical protein